MPKHTIEALIVKLNKIKVVLESGGPTRHNVAYLDINLELTGKNEAAIVIERIPPSRGNRYLLSAPLFHSKILGPDAVGTIMTYVYGCGALDKVRKRKRIEASCVEYRFRGAAHQR